MTVSLDALDAPAGISHARTGKKGRIRMKRRSRPSRIVLGLVACVAMLAACGSSSKKSSASSNTAVTAGSSSKYPAIPAGPITFGISLPLSGATASFGTLAQKHFGVVLNEFNQLHPTGIDGHPVKFDILNDASDVTQAVNVANQMVANKDAAVVEISFNPASESQQLAILNKAKLPVFTCVGLPTGDDPALFPYYFGMCASTAQTGQAGADWITKHTEIQKIGVLSDGAAASEDLLNAILNPLKTSDPNAKVVKTTTISPGSVEVSTQIAQLKATNPDLLIVDVGFGYGPIWQA